jgi:hypothetical protein
MWQGTCERFADVDCSALVAWITSVPFTEWPQQHPVDELIRPAMCHDMSWHDFGAVSSDTIAELWNILGQPRIVNRMLSVVMPGHDILSHADHLAENWICRVHVPLTTNDKATFTVELEEHRMLVGGAYRVNISRTHSVFNGGKTPRIHLMFDCYEP